MKDLRGELAGRTSRTRTVIATREAPWWITWVASDRENKLVLIYWTCPILVPVEKDVDRSMVWCGGRCGRLWMEVARSPFCGVKSA